MRTHRWIKTVFPIVVLFSVILSANAAGNLNSEFRMAAGMGQMERVIKLLEQGADINSRGPSTDRVPGGITALSLAATRNHPEMVKYLISRGANVNQADDGGATPLIYATWKGNKEVIEILLAHGANVNARTRDGRTAISVARKAGRSDLETMLKDALK